MEEPDSFFDSPGNPRSADLSFFGGSTSFFRFPQDAEGFDAQRSDEAAPPPPIHAEVAEVVIVPTPSVDTHPPPEQDYTTTLQQQAEAFRAQQSSYQTWLLDYLSQAVDPGSDTDDYLPPDHSPVVPSLMTAIYSAWVGRSFLHYHKEAAEAGKELERKLREAEALRAQLSPFSDPSPAAAIDTPLDQYLHTLHECTTALSTAWHARDAASFYSAPAWPVLPALQDAATALDQRLQHSRYSLYQQLVQDIQDTLQAAAWPPPLVPSTPTPHHQQHQHRQPAFSGFSSARLLPRLNGLLACLNQLQVACERQQFSALQAAAAAAAAHAHAPPSASDPGGPGPAAPLVHEGPALWSMSQLSSQLQARLQSHFSPGTEAGRVDHPEWLLRTVVGFLQDNVKFMEELQPSISQSQLHGHYHACVEFVRAVREAVRAVLRCSRLPALLQEPDPRRSWDPLWVLQVDAILEFEKQLAPFLGSLSNDSDHPDVPEALSSGSCLCAVTQEPDFLAAWAAAERGLAQERIGPLDLTPGAGGGAGAGAGWGAAEGGVEAWRREFNPPEVAERVVDAVAALVERSRHIAAAAEQRVFLELSAGQVLDAMEHQLRSVLADSCDAWDTDDDAEGAGSVTSAQRITLVCACVTASHFLHHQVSELQLSPALLRINQPEEPQPPPTTSWEAAAAHPKPASHNPHFLSPSKAAGFDDVALQPSFWPLGRASGSGVLAARAASLAALHREWCLCIAQDLARGFGRLAVHYREEVVRAACYPAPGGAADAPSPQLLPALAWLEQRLASLAGLLDGPSFRDIWRAVLVPINRFMFNHIATESRFTAEGGAQLEADARALAALLAPFTQRPAAHLRETLGAARLLGLGDDEAAEVVRRVSGLALGSGGAAAAPGPAYKKDPLLVHLGVICLTPQQILAVIERRV